MKVMLYVIEHFTIKYVERAFHQRKIRVILTTQGNCKPITYLAGRILLLSFFLGALPHRSFIGMFLFNAPLYNKL
jgi:hypothetical protein